jgi:hypothetical protein
VDNDIDRLTVDVEQHVPGSKSGMPRTGHEPSAEPVQSEGHGARPGPRLRSAKDEVKVKV